MSKDNNAKKCLIATINATWMRTFVEARNDAATKYWMLSVLGVIVTAIAIITLMTFMLIGFIPAIIFSMVVVYIGGGLSEPVSRFVDKLIDGWVTSIDKALDEFEKEDKRD